MDLSNIPEALQREIEAIFGCLCLFQGSWPGKEETADVAYVPGLAVDNWQGGPVDDGILETAASLVRNGHARLIAIPGYSGTYEGGRGGSRVATGYPGGTVWRRELLLLGVPVERIVLVGEEFGPSGESHNTRTEVDAFVRAARVFIWRRVIVVGVPFHLPRVMLTLLKSLQEQGMHEVHLWPVTPRTISWRKAVYHSQGAEKLPGYQHIGREWSRIPTYQEQGWISSFTELYGHLVSGLGSS